LVLVKAHNPPLLDDAEPGHLVGKGILIEHFNEPIAERNANPESTPNNPLGHSHQQPRIPFIHLHPAHPP
jgi:hypothetical protein